MARNYTKLWVGNPLISNEMLQRMPFGKELMRRRRTRRALANRRLNLSGATELNFDVLVVSPGGSGSTQLITHIAEFYKCNSRQDLDGLKHLPTPPARTLAKKIVFVHRDAVEVRRSLERRGITSMQLRKLRPEGMSFANPAYWSVERLVALQLKAFQEVAHTEVLFVHYRDLFESAQVIGEFLGHKDGFVETFPARKSLRALS